MKHALILGASGGIGSALSEKLNNTYRLSLVGRDSEKLKALKNRLTNADIIPTDLASELEVSALFEMLEPIDLLVYSAGEIQVDLLKTTRFEHFQRVMDANLNGLFYCLKYAEAKLNQGSRVYVLGARADLIKYRGFATYAAAKAGVKALVEIAAIEMKRKTQFTLVLPRATATPFWKNLGNPPKDALSAAEVAKAISNSLEREAQDSLVID